MRRPLILVTLSLTLGCSTPGDKAPPTPPSPAEALLPIEKDLVQRLAEVQQRRAEAEALHAESQDGLAVATALSPTESIHSTMNALEHLLPSWMAEQRRGRAAPLETILVLKVVPAFEGILQMFTRGPHERRLVAAWALGFSRVPDNELGVASRHEEARDALVAAIPGAPDDVLNNILLGLWILGDEGTPLDLLTEIMRDHHDPAARANATLTLAAVLTDDNAASVVGALLVALDDSEPKVRLHAARVAIDHPHPALTVRLEEKLGKEQTPLVQAAIASALGAARSVTSGPVLLPLLEAPREVVSASAHAALVRIYGFDVGTTVEDWEQVTRR